MMRIAIFSDVHGNLSALRAVTADIERRPDLERVIFAGDLCLFGPRPQATLDLLQQRSWPAIVGNTDEWIRQPPPELDSAEAEKQLARLRLRDLCDWTESQLGAESLVWLDDLRTAFHLRLTPTSDPRDDLLIVHANPHNLLDIIFPSVDVQESLYGRVRQSDDDVAPLLVNEPARAIAFGHLHVPGIRRWQDKKLINCSSVSLPGDGDPRAKYAILTWAPESGWAAEIVRIEYKVSDEIEAFRRHRPPGWAERVDELTTLGYIPQIV